MPLHETKAENRYWPIFGHDKNLVLGAVGFFEQGDQFPLPAGVPRSADVEQGRWCFDVWLGPGDSGDRQRFAILIIKDSRIRPNISQQQQ